MGMLTVAGSISLAVGLLVRGRIGAGLVGIGAGLMAGALLRSAIPGGTAGFMLGGAGGYFVGLEEGLVLGALLGGILGSGIAYFFGEWATDIRKKIDVDIEVTQAVMERNRTETLQRFRNVHDTLKAIGPYHADPEFIVKEYRYVKNRLRDIKFDRHDPRTMRDAMVSYEDVLAELDRLEHEMEPYTASISWAIDPKRYGGGFSENGLTTIEGYGPVKKGKGVNEGEDEDVKKPLIPSAKYGKGLKVVEGTPVPEELRKRLGFLGVESQLHDGEYANVYVTRTEDGQERVVKIPRIKMGMERDLPTMAEFMYCAKLWGDLEHENIVKIFDNDTRPVPYISMEKMGGGILGNLIREDGLVPGEAVHIMLEVLKGLSYAHTKGVRHLNISPNNILLTAGGTIKITDWGWDRFLAIAHRENFLIRRKRSGYCAPEHLKPGKYGKPDARTDVFLAGILLYELITGLNPFKDEDEEKAEEKILELVSVPPSGLNGDVPKRLDFIVMKALEKEMDDRWNNAEEMREAIVRLTERAAGGKYKTVTNR